MLNLLKILKTNIIFEAIGEKVNCEKCDHSWDIEKDDKEPYLCHMCNYDNAKKEFLDEKWSEKYKKTINCNNPKGFSQRAHCQGRKKRKK